MIIVLSTVILLSLYIPIIMIKREALMLAYVLFISILLMIGIFYLPEIHLQLFTN
jgi:hypothetical protein